MALGSEELLNVLAGGIEDGREVSGSHLDLCFLSWGVTAGERGQESGVEVGYIFCRREAGCRRSSRIWHTKFNFCGVPRQGWVVVSCVTGVPEFLLAGRLQLPGSDGQHA